MARGVDALLDMLAARTLSCVVAACTFLIVVVVVSHEAVEVGAQGLWMPANDRAGAQATRFKRHGRGQGGCRALPAPQ